MIQPIGLPIQLKTNIKQEQAPVDKKLQQACTDFEAMMVKKMLETMLGNTKIFGSGFSGDFYQGMFTDAVAESISKQGGIGLRKMLMEQMGKTMNNGQ